MCYTTNSSSSDTTSNDSYKSPWPIEIECGLGLSTGVCIDGECICAKGYQHDMSYVRYRNCSVPTLFFPVIFGIQLFSLLVLIPYVFMRYRESKSIAKTSLLSLLVASTLFLIHCIVHISFSFVFNSYTFFLLYFVIFFLSISNGITVFSLVTPLAAVATKSSKTLRKTIIALTVFFKIMGFIPVVIASALYDNPKDKTNDRIWSNLTLTFTFAVGMESVAFISFFVVYGSQMVRLIEEINNSEVASQHNKSIGPYLGKVKMLIFRNQVIAIPLALCNAVLPFIQYIAGSTPFNFVFYAFAMLNSPAMMFIVAKYASKSVTKIQESAEDNSRSQGQKSLRSDQDRVTKDSNIFLPEVKTNGNGETLSVRQDARDIHPIDDFHRNPQGLAE